MNNEKIQLIKLILVETILQEGDPGVLAKLKKALFPGNKNKPLPTPQFSPGKSKPSPTQAKPFGGLSGPIPVGWGDDETTVPDLGPTMVSGAATDKTSPGQQSTSPGRPSAIFAGKIPEIQAQSEQVQVSMPAPGNINLVLGQKKSGRVLVDFSNPNKIIVTDK